MAGFVFLVVLAVTVTAFSAETPLRILFIGNSYTYYNNLPGLVEEMARAGGRPVEAQSVTLGGATLEGIYAGSNALAVLRGQRWDLVVLQEHSTLGLYQFNGDMVVNSPAAFFAWARIWDAEIRAQGARPVFLNTWARKGRAELQTHIDWSYAAIARELGAGLIPVGAAFQGVTDVELYEPDGSHPSAAGSYLAACVAVEILTALGCAGAAAEIVGLPMDNASARLREGAREVIVRLSAETAARLQVAALSAVQRLRTEGGYWRLPRPLFAGEDRADRVQELISYDGRWEGTTWLYGRKAKITLQVATNNSECSGTWQISAMEPPTQTILPLEDCTAGSDLLRFVVKPLFLTSELHEAWGYEGRLQGRVLFKSLSPYVRQAGTWTLQRVEP